MPNLVPINLLTDMTLHEASCLLQKRTPDPPDPPDLDKGYQFSADAQVLVDFVLGHGLFTEDYSIFDLPDCPKAHAWELHIARHQNWSNLGFHAASVLCLLENHLPEVPLITINLNDSVTVTLTDAGREVLQGYYNENQYPGCPAQIARVGKYQDQIWHIMHIFGAQCFNGGRQLFVENTMTWSPKP